MATLREKQQERAKLAEDAGKILSTAKEQNRAMNPDERSQFTKMHERVDALKVEIDDEVRQNAAEVEVATRQASREQIDPNTGDEEKRYAETFSKFIRFGREGLEPEERQLLQKRYRAPEGRAQGIATGGAGGFTVPTGFYDQLIDAQKWFGGMRDVGATVFTTDNGENVQIPLDNDTANKGAILAENTQETALDLGAFTQKTIGAYMYSSKLVLVSLQLLQDSKFDIEGFLRKKLGQRLGRILNDHFTVGTGTGQPQGVITGAVVGQTGATGQTLTVTYKDLIELEHSVDPAYRRNGQGVSTRWMFNDSTLRVLKELTDSQNRPLWKPAISAGIGDKVAPDTIDGFPYVINQSVAVMAANAKSIAFGDFSNYLIRDVTGATVLRLDERYADFLQVGFIAFERHDGLLMDAGTNPVKYYANSAT